MLFDDDDDNDDDESHAYQAGSLSINLLTRRAVTNEWIRAVLSACVAAGVKKQLR